MSTKITIPGNKGVWHGYDSYRFEVDGIESIIVAADSPLKGNPWIWRARFFNADPALDLAMLRHGFHLVHTDITDLAGGAEAMQRMNNFYRYLTSALKFSETPVLEAYSRGAFPALNWVIRNPQKTAMLILDRPICNLKTWPSSPFDKDLCRKIGVLKEDFSVIPEWNPVDNLTVLAEYKVPITVIYDENDHVFPVMDNSILLLERLKAGNGVFQAYTEKQNLTADDIEMLAHSAIHAVEEKTAQ